MFGCAGSSLLLEGVSLAVVSRGCSLAAVCWILTVVASFVAERRFYGAWASVVMVHMLSWPSACGTFPDEGSTMSPALAGGFLTSGLPEIPSLYLF